MSALRSVPTLAVISLALLGAVPVAATALAPETDSRGPVQILELTTSHGDATPLAQAGLDAESAVEEADTPASTSVGESITPRRAHFLAALVDVDPERDATLLTEPMEVGDFVVAGFTWNDSQNLPAGVHIYLRVREGDTWSPWYLNEAVDGGPDGVAHTSGTQEFATGGADAIQAAVLGPADLIPADLALTLLPAQPTGEEILTKDDVTAVDAVSTEVAPESDTGGDVQEAAPVAPVATMPARANQVDAAPDAEATPLPTTTIGSENTAPAATSAGHMLNPRATALLQAATTANRLPVSVQTRSDWGANPNYMQWDPEYVRASHVVVHHTAGTNNYTAAQSRSIVQGIYYYHAVTLDWGDIGYNFLVDKYGQVFEGRYGTLQSAAGRMVIGGHAYGANTGTMGVSMMGNYSGVNPTSVQIDRVGKLAGWFLSRAGVTNVQESAAFTIRSTEKYRAGQVISLPRILAHRDVGYTTCPGDAGYAHMGTIRSVAQDQVTASSSSTAPAAQSYRWKAEGGQWYLLDSAGRKLTGWRNVDGTRYYLNSDGVMATGWLRVGGQWYYFDPSGAMATGWRSVSGTWYYLNSDGVMATGWLRVGGQWYYLNSSGAMAIGWVRDGSAWYYCNASGVMLTGRHKIDGYYSSFDSSGRWLGYR